MNSIIKRSQQNTSSTPPYIENVPPDEVIALFEEGMQMVKKYRGYDLNIRKVTPMILKYTTESEAYGIENALFHAITTAYYMGIAKGVRMKKRHSKA